MRRRQAQERRREEREECRRWVWRPRGRSGSDRGAQEREEREVHPRRAGWLNSARSHGCLLAAPREIIGYNRGRGGDACSRCEMASNQPLRHSNSFIAEANSGAAQTEQLRLPLASRVPFKIKL